MNYTINIVSLPTL